MRVWIVGRLALVPGLVSTASKRAVSIRMSPPRPFWSVSLTMRARCSRRTRSSARIVTSPPPACWSGGGDVPGS
ncbi:MAG: hypothetical protein R3E53_02035 [Myxococcota bacterium]